MHINFEFKARTSKLEELEEKLKTLKPIFVGNDHQIDTYFNTQNGRLKFREGNIENSLIHYNRPDIADAKQSDVLLYNHQNSKILKEILVKSIGVKVIVDKQRKIYFIDNVKFHFDIVESLGTFVEVEAIDKDCNIGIEKLQEKCKFYAELFDIKQEDYINCSYSDLIIARANYQSI
jgi:predicted adenylyl cyclase CyaB